LNTNFTILIADRNPNVREFLKRELLTEGYLVRLARNGREVLNWIYHYGTPDLLIIDPSLPDESEFEVLDKLKERVPNLPVVIHTFSSEYMPTPSTSPKTAFVEKKGNSIEIIKKVLLEVLQKTASPHFKAS
jgi:DNA-binding NtrC family response regulator